MSESTITRHTINESRLAQLPLAVDHETWLRWLEGRIDPTWRLGEWDAENWFFDGDPEREGSMVTRCAVQRCGVKLEGESLCTTCLKAWRGSGLALEVFAVQHAPRRTKILPGTEAEGCLVARGAASCARPAICRGLCRSHYSLLRLHQARDSSLSLDVWLAAGQDPYPADQGRCAVPRCDQQPDLRDGLCRYHHGLYLREGHEASALEWAATAHPHLTAGQFSMLPLRPLVRAELLYAVQRRDASGDRILPRMLRRLIREVKHHEHLVGLGPDQLSPIKGNSNDLDSHRRDIVHWLQVGYEEMTGADPTRRLIWDFRNLDLRGSTRSKHRRTHGGRADFTAISQTWLRDLAMERCRTFTTSTKILEILTAVEVASRALEATTDGGHQIRDLGPQHLDAITQAFRNWTHPDGQPRSTTRRYVGLDAVFALVDFGRRSRMMKDVTDAFLRDPEAHRLQLDPPAREEVGKAIPEGVIAQLDQNLAQLECNAKYPDMAEDHQRLMIRTLYIVLRDTGRRPREVCALRTNCVGFDHDGPVLIWDNTKAGRKRRHLPIPSETAESIAAWRAVRDTLFTGDPRDDYLFPSGTPERIDPHYRPASLTRSLRLWVDGMPHLLSDANDARGDRIPFDRLKVYPYAFRHSYAQRHADAGVQIDVLCELMDHRSISTTQGYYRVNQKRKREAIRTLSMQVTDRHGDPAPTASGTAYEMRSVAAPFGNCIEPSNVKAGGGSCPIRFQCSGCGFYRPDPSYLPVIEDHIRSLKADRETAAAMDVDIYVLRNLDDQIDSYRHVLGAMKENLDALPYEEQQEVEQAGILLRRLRAGSGGRTQLPLTIKTRTHTP
ncbi:site-specific integrase [Arthrobacter sp. ISL-65]|uniref:tyrosine-type recombinase/integrase n=1 Tax=Arthrobacter sp. ISL-65 TaxID=2819112 RepID=UPI001BEA9449|nr:site-specific integrase [Arthrobacter sp. ISL-65]MBT2547201.1 site-specific integrase [Arthrobacter sp. ISL-65]